MDGAESHFTVRMLFSFFLLIVLQSSSEAQIICSARGDVTVQENMTAGVVVENITVEDRVTLAFKPGTGDVPFRLEGNQLLTTEALDYENTQRYVINIVCSQEVTDAKLDLIVIVFVTNVNDNPPVFGENLYRTSVSEMSPVDTLVGRFSATDLDNPNQLYYTLTSESNDFKLRSATAPDVLVNKLLEYDKVKTVQLVLQVQDTPLTPPVEPSFTATTTIVVTITDRDDRPPWFQPCAKQEVGGAVVCQSFGYTGRVDQNEQATGVLPLKPGPLYAIDGDSGINEEVTYTFLSGNDDGVFDINPNTGNISMLKPTDALGTVALTVMAAQRINSYQFATTTVAISVQVKSLHPPKFQKPVYEAVVTAVGAMALDPNNKNEPLRIIATDDDYASEGLNPYISYIINGNRDFTIIDGFLFMMRDLPDATLTLQVVALDTSNDESATADLLVTVMSGLTTTTLPLSTDLTSMTTVGESTTDSSVSTPVSTPSSSTSTDSVSTTDPSVTSDGSSTGSTAHPPTVIVPSGRFGATDMAALGASLGVLLFVCLVVIGVLIHRMRKGKADWKKIHEASVFRSSLGKGSSGNKEGIQYSNEAFENDDDGGSTGSSGPAEGSEAGDKPPKKTAELVLKEANARSLASLHDLLPDDVSQDGSDKADSEKEVKPILTKERRLEDGYKAVWFKEDIDPNAKEEVVIIPHSRENYTQDDDEEQRADLDSGIGVRMEEPAQDFNTDFL